MADDIGSWIVNSIIQHDQKYGAGLQVPWKGSRYCQLIEFNTFRDDEHPHAEVSGVISDKTHHVRVVFDVDATDRFEIEPGPGLPYESLTSHLRAIFQLQSFSYRLERDPEYVHQPGTSPMLELPSVVLQVHQWAVVVGDRNDPVFHENTFRVGRGRSAGDAEVQRVLRKWWFGESHSDPSQSYSSQIETPSRQNQRDNPTPSSLRGKPLMPSPPPQQAPIPMPADPAQDTLVKFLQPYLISANGKKAKPIPEWIFEKPDDARRQLDDISVFGLDLGQEEQSVAADVKSFGEPQDETAGAGNVPPTGLVHPVEDDEPVNKPNLEEMAVIAERDQQEHSTAQAAGNVFLPLDNGEASQPHQLLQVSQPSQPSRSDSRSASPPPPGQRPPPTQTTENDESMSTIPTPALLPNATQSDDEDDGEIPIRPLVVKRSLKQFLGRKNVFDPLSIPTPSASPDVNDEEDDDEGLSDYEREERRRQKARAPDPSETSGSGDAQPAHVPGSENVVESDNNVEEDTSAQMDIDVQAADTADRSISASQQSDVGFSLSRYTTVGHGSEAVQQNASSGGNGAMEEPVSQPTSTPQRKSPTPPVRKRSRSAEASGSTQAPPTHTQDSEKGNEADISKSSDEQSHPLSLSARRPITALPAQHDVATKETATEENAPIGSVPLVSFESARKKAKLEVHTPAPTLLGRTTREPSSVSASGSSVRGSRKGFLSGVKMLFKAEPGPQDGDESPLKDRDANVAEGSSSGAGGILGRLAGWARSPSKSETRYIAAEQQADHDDDVRQDAREEDDQEVARKNAEAEDPPRIKERDFAFSVETRTERTRTPKIRTERYHPYIRESRTESGINHENRITRSPSSSPSAQRVSALPGFQPNLRINGVNEEYVRKALIDIRRRRAASRAGKKGV